MFGKTLVTGGSGFLGSHLVKRLRGLCSELVVPRSAEYDLRSQAQTLALFADHGPFDLIFHLAATVSGIGAIAKQPATYFFDNLVMGLNVIHAAHLTRAGKVIVAGSVCAYPLKTSIPMDESELWNGKPEPTNGAYGIAKRVLHTALEAYRDQHGLKSAYLLMANLYGPGDDFSPLTSHVIPALIRKMHENPELLEVWGSGTASRDFLYVQDAVSAFCEAAVRISKPLPTNIGTGYEMTIRDLVLLLADLLPYHGSVVYDTSKPDGQPRRSLSLERAKYLIPAWAPQVNLVDGLTATIDWYRKEYRNEQALQRR